MDSDIRSRFRRIDGFGPSPRPSVRPVQLARSEVVRRPVAVPNPIRPISFENAQPQATAIPETIASMPLELPPEIPMRRKRPTTIIWVIVLLFSVAGAGGWIYYSLNSHKKANHDFEQQLQTPNSAGT